MTQEHKELLLKDICARLPYGIKCIVTKSRTEEGQKGDVGKIICVCLEGVDCIDNTLFFSEFGNFKPYLFPLSSMTEEEWEDYQKIRMIDWVHGDINGTFINAGLIVDWLNAHHFDYRGLIEKGLAIDATNLNIY